MCICSLGGAGVEAKAQLVRLKAKVQEMESQRAELLQKLRSAFDEDDITTQLIASKEQDVKELFKQNLKKHDHLVRHTCREKFIYPFCYGPALEIKIGRVCQINSEEC